MSDTLRPNYGTQPAQLAPPYEAEVLAGLERDAATVVARYPQPRSALLPLLHLVQSVDGYVSTRGIEFCARTLGLTAAEVSGVATFYTQYKRFPNGDYTLGVCTNTLCAVLGGDEIFERLSEHLGIGHDETTADGKITLERIECNAACDYAPVVMANWEFFDDQTPESAVELADALASGEVVRPSRGAERVCTFRQVSRVLAGFPDGRADEGPSAGPASVAGLRVAHDRGWRAPASPAQAHATRQDGADTAAGPEGSTGAGTTNASGVQTGSAQATTGAPDATRATGSVDSPANDPGETPGSGGQRKGES